MSSINPSHITLDIGPLPLAGARKLFHGRLYNTMLNALYSETTEYSHAA